jgi:putative tricarboxylic transport membrane protein
MNHLVRNGKDFWAGVMYIGFGSGFTILGRGYEMGRALRMGPSYFPTILGGLLIFIGTISLIRSFIRPGEPIGAFALKGLVLIIASILLFGSILRGAGLAIALPVLVIVSSCASTRFRWKYSFAFAVGLTIFSILVFVKGLGVPIPVVGSWFGG